MAASAVLNGEGGRRSQIDTVRNASGDVLSTITTTFDGERFSRTIEPAIGPSQTQTWDKDGPVPELHKANAEAFAVGALLTVPAAVALAPTLPIIALGAAAVAGIAFLTMHADSGVRERSRYRRTPNDVAEQLNAAIARARATKKKKPSDPDGRNPPPLVPPISVIWSRDGGETAERTEMSPEELEKFCRAYPKVQQAANAVVRALDEQGFPRGKEFGQQAHKDLKNYLTEWSGKEGELKRHGIEELHLEQGFGQGIHRTGFLKRGDSRIDVVEILDRDVACIYDLKTGRREFDEATRQRYMRELKGYLNGKGYTKILVIELRAQEPPHNR